jgi:hypothetical protein
MRITYHGMHGAGRTLTEARRDAAQKIEQALSGTYDPVLLPLPDGDIMLGFRTPAEGWSYWFWRDGRLSGGCLCALTTREELERRMRRHAAQSTEDSRYLEHPTCTEQDKRDFDEYRAWQQRYAAAQAQGLSDSEAHAYASSPPDQPASIGHPLSPEVPR